MEALYNEMCRLGIDEYNTLFLVAGVDSIAALSRCTDAVPAHTPPRWLLSASLPQELYDIGVESASERRRILELICNCQIPESEDPEPAPACTASPETTTAPQVPPEEPGGMPHLEEGMDELLRQQNLELQLQIEGMSCQLEAAVQESSQHTESVAELQLRHDEELGALRRNAEEELSELRGEFDRYKGLAEAKAEERDKCIMELEQQLDLEREMGRSSLREQLDEFMAQVSRLEEEKQGMTEQIHELQSTLQSSQLHSGRMSDQVDELEQMRAEHRELQQALAEAGALNKTLEGQLEERDQYVAEFRDTMRDQMAACRTEVRAAEVQAQSRALQLQQDCVELQGKVGVMEAAAGSSTAKHQASIARLKEQLATGAARNTGSDPARLFAASDLVAAAWDEAEDQLISALSDLTAAPGPDTVNGAEMVALSSVTDSVRHVFSLNRPEALVSAGAGAPAAPEATLGEKLLRNEPLDSQPTGMVDTLYSAMEMLNPFGIDE